MVSLEDCLSCSALSRFGLGVKHNREHPGEPPGFSLTQVLCAGMQGFGPYPY